MNKFNIRVYGLLINAKHEILITDEKLENFNFTKFPGGGLEHGEGLIDALKREFMEECAIEIEVLKHFYTTDFYVKSLFGEEQLIAIYYLVKPVHSFHLPISIKAFDFSESQPNQCFRMTKISKLQETEMTFPVDKHIVNLLKEQWI